MALVIIQSSRLSKDQKKRIGDQVIEAFHREGVLASSVVVLFQREANDILLDGGLLIEATLEDNMAPPIQERKPEYRQVPISIPVSAPVPDYKSKARRNRTELAELRSTLAKLLQAEGALTSFQAQERLGLKDCDWAPATLRRFFSELEAEGMITKQGQKRGTRYLWKGLVVQQGQPKSALPKLVKKSTQEESMQDEGSDQEN